jgi:hypothetical protein
MQFIIQCKIIWKKLEIYNYIILCINNSSFPFPFVPLQRRGCLVAPWFLWIVLVPCAGDKSSDRGGEERGEYDRVSKRDRLGLTPDLTSRDLWRSATWAREREKGNVVYSSLWDFKSSFTYRNILRHGTFPLYFPPERKVCRGLSPLKSIALVGFWTRNLWVQWPAH